MKKTWIILTALVLLLALSAVGYRLLGARAAVPAPAPVSPAQTAAPAPTDTPSGGASAAPAAESAPDFTVQDADGNPVTLSERLGKPVVVNLWASWCGYCVRELPDFEDAYQRYGEEIDFMMVDVWEDAADADAFIAENGYTFPILYDAEQSATGAYRVRGIPVTIFVGADGALVDMHTGMLDQITLENYLQKILGR